MLFSFFQISVCSVDDESVSCDLTDDSIAAVAANCPHLAELNVRDCKHLTDALIAAVAEKCASLAELDVGDCSILTDASRAAVADNCRNLEVLSVVNCELAALPANIGKLSRLRQLLARGNQLKELPRSIVELDASCHVDVTYNSNPLELSTNKIWRQGIPAIKRYFEEHDDTA